MVDLGIERIDNKGVLIVLEGIDGTGKTTQAQMLVTKLRESGYDPVHLHEPTRSVWGMKIRELFAKGRSVSPEEELHYFIEDRKLDVKENILPALNRGQVVVLDRYYISNAAYQGALGIEPTKIIKMNSFAPEPDLVLILDLPAEVGLSRINNREHGAPNFFEILDYQRKVRTIFHRLKDVLKNTHIIDASPSAEELASTLWKICNEYLSSQDEERFVLSK